MILLLNKKDDAFFERINETLESKIESVFNVSEVFNTTGNIFIILAAILFLIKTYTIISKAMIGGKAIDPTDFFPLIKTFILILTFSFFLPIFEEVVSYTADYYKALGEKIDDEFNFKTVFEKNFKEVYASLQKENEDIDISDFTTKAINKLIFSIGAIPSYGICYIVDFLDYLTLIFVNIISIIWLNVLRLFAPLALVLSLFPPTSDSFKVWIKNYISVVFWIPIASLFIVICNIFNVEILKEVPNLVSISGLK